MDRSKVLISALKERGLDAAVLHRPENMFYITGYTGEGCVFVSQNGCTLVTDFRYVEQASRQAPTAQCEQTTREISEASILKKLTDAQGVRTLAVETDYLSVDSYRAIENKLSFVKLESLQGLLEELRLIKDAGEIECICRACDITSRAFDNLLGKIHAGMTERQVKILLDYEMLNLGSEENAFPTIAAAGINGSLPHATPSDHIIAKGEMLTLDFGAKFGGYCADMTRTVAFGHISDALREIYDMVYAAHMAALAAVAPGKICGDIDRIARDMIDARYAGAFGHSLGHGVGLFIHEQPRVSPGSQTVLAHGHVITIEPGVYIPGVGGCRIEDTAILTSDGYLDPVTSPKHLIEL